MDIFITFMVFTLVPLLAIFILAIPIKILFKLFK